MTQFQQAVDVAVPARTAYDQCTRFESFPQFMVGVAAVRRIDDRTTRWTTTAAGGTREFDTRVCEDVPDQRLAWRTLDPASGKSGALPGGAVTFDPLDDLTTRVTLWLDDDALDRAVSEQLVDRIQGNLGRFKEFVESRGHPRGWGPDPRSAVVGSGPEQPSTVTSMAGRPGQVPPIGGPVLPAPDPGNG